MTFSPEALLSLLRCLQDAPSCGKPTMRVRYVITAPSETPLPTDGNFAPRFDASALAWTLGESPGELVSTAMRVVQSLAYLPVDPVDEAIVDRLAAKHTPRGRPHRLGSRGG